MRTSAKKYKIQRKEPLRIPCVGKPSLTPAWGTGLAPSSHSIASLKLLDVLRKHPGSGSLSLRPPYAPESFGNLGQNIDPRPYFTHASLVSRGAGSGNLFLFWAVARRSFFPQPACSRSSGLQKHLSPDNNSWSHWYRGPEVLKHYEAKHIFKKPFLKSCLLTTSHLGIIISQYSWHLVETTSLRFFHHVIALQDYLRFYKISILCLYLMPILPGHSSSVKMRIMIIVNIDELLHRFWEQC